MTNKTIKHSAMTNKTLKHSAMTNKTLKHEYSPAESALLEMLSNDRGITIGELTERYYAGRKTPFHGRIFVNSTMRTLMTKAKINRDVKIVRSNVRPYEYRLAK